MEKKNWPTIQNLIDSIYEDIEAEKANPCLNGYIPYLEIMVKYFEDAQRAREEGKLVVAHTTQLPTEVFFAMDIVPFYLEFYCLFVNFYVDLKQYLEVAAEHGIPPEVCSVHRVTDAMVITGSFPPVDGYVFSNLVCDNTPKGGEGMAALDRNAPAYFLDRPYKFSEHSLSYWREELEDLIHFLEELCGRKMDYDRLGEAIKSSHQIIEIMKDMNEFRKAIPYPLPAKAFFLPLAVYSMLAGDPKIVSFCDKFIKELEERVANRVGAVPDERFRIVLPFIAPFWDMSLMELMETEYGAVTVMDCVTTWEPEMKKWVVDPSAHPLDNLARKSFVYPPGSYCLHGPLQLWVDDAVKMARDYKADGAIFWAHIGCRQGCATIRAMKDELQDKVDIPMAVIDGDLVDRSFTSRAEVKEKLDRFFEMLEERKEGK